MCRSDGEIPGETIISGLIRCHFQSFSCHLQPFIWFLIPTLVLNLEGELSLELMTNL